MGKYTIGLLLSSAVLWAGAAHAENFKLSGNKHWLAVASTKNLDEAIGIARVLGSEGARVVSSQSGYFGVVLGPYVTDSVEELKKKNENLNQLPSDALLSNGARYIETVWKAATSSNVLADYEKDKPVQLSSGDLSVTVKLEKTGEDQYNTVATGGQPGSPQFSFTVGSDGEYTDIGSGASLIKLDPKSTVPQVVFTRFTGGAHCCTNTWVASKLESASGWALKDLGKLDGGGYWFEDVDGDGAQELLSADNAFLYAFDSYAGSFAPIHIAKFRDGSLEDVSEDGNLRPRLVQDLAGMEYQATVNSDLWKSNGFLVAWVASKIRLGDGADAWPTVMENYDKSAEFGPQECTSGQKVDDCPTENLKTIPFPKALASFLKENGYGPLPSEAEQELK